jgi:hypothetical protein
MKPSSLQLASLLQPDVGFGLSLHAASTAILHAPYDVSLANFKFNQWSPDPLLSLDGLSQAQDEWMPSSVQQDRGPELFFDHVFHFLPFLHRPTFDANHISRPLLLSMLCLGYQHEEDLESGDDPGSGVNLSTRCFLRARTLIAAEEEHLEEGSHGLVMVQTYISLLRFAMMYSDERDSA